MIAPLRKRTREGVLYVRRPMVDAEIVELAALPEPDLVARCEYRRGQPGYVSSEAVVHFVRVRRDEGDNPVFRRLYEILAERVLRALPKADNADGQTLSMSKTLIREKAFDRFKDVLLQDRRSYDGRLDYYEINFDGTVANLRRDAQKAVWREQNRSTTLEADGDDEEISAEVEAAVGSYDPLSAAELDDARYRSRLDAAIDALPPLQRRIVEMLRQNIPIDSVGPDVVTIRGVLGKAEKTIRNQRDKAFVTLRIKLMRGEKA